MNVSITIKIRSDYICIPDRKRTKKKKEKKIKKHIYVDFFKIKSHHALF